MSGLRVDTFKIFNSRRGRRCPHELAFNHIRGLLARPGLDDWVEMPVLQ